MVIILCLINESSSNKSHFPISILFNNREEETLWYAYLTRFSTYINTILFDFISLKVPTFHRIYITFNYIYILTYYTFPQIFNPLYIWSISSVFFSSTFLIVKNIFQDLDYIFDTDLTMIINKKNIALSNMLMCHIYHM